MKNRSATYTCINCGTKHAAENGQAPKTCVKCDGSKFTKSCGN
jgi:DNA-directed RNA polymerase subunit RPC12/RpoP